ncbi:glucosamine-6-phosphate deaminase [Arthrobacter sp. fls2-241-R2A-200]|uniref:glucosamine-6-phosphate deaminase n=1 Tax=unclassified Arthrobacter TaxID=235627 RepID=UPI00254C283C|nr:glucosamine-6-phosphate deaminase [Arthrobacter sp. fls2-241-R2A-200]
MRITVAESAAALGRAAAMHVWAHVQAEPHTVLGVATGSSPLPLYQYLADHPGPDFGAVTCFALDEYLGLPAGHEQSYAGFVRKHISEPLAIPSARVHVPQATMDDAGTASAEYEARIRAAGGIDLQILGIGRNGHLAFNEPGSSFHSRTRVVALTQDSREANSRFFPSLDDVPTHAITQGLGTIQEAGHLLLVATGQDKAQAVNRALLGPVTEEMPASLLQLHPKVTLVLDRAAAGMLPLEVLTKYAPQASAAAR